MSSLDAPSSPPIGDLAVVIVLYNSTEVIAECLRSLPREVQVILVDNASTDDGLAAALALRPDAVAVRSERNLGFGGGCNLGWRAAGRPYIAFVNPDVRAIRDALALLLERLAAEERTMVGPKLLNEEGTPRRCKRRPSPLLDFLGLLPAAARWAPAGWNGKLDPADPVHRTGGRVSCVEGACFLIRRDDLEAIGGFDEDFFLYYEEESLALRLERCGGGAFYEPRAVVAHAGGASTRQRAAFSLRQFHRSRVIFYRKRDGELRGRLTGLMLALGLLISAPAVALNAVLIRRRATTLSTLQHALSGVRDGIAVRLRSQVEY